VADGVGTAGLAFGVAGVATADAVTAGGLAGTLDGAATGLVEPVGALAPDCDGLAEQPVITAATAAAASAAWVTRVAASFMSCSLSRARAWTHL
jgi:hypothetical protein